MWRGTQYIKLSRNVAFTSTNTYPAVTGATVAISDSLGNTYPFTEGPAGTYTSTRPHGVAGQRYSMTVTTGGQTYTANSTMPAAVGLDSITSQPRAFGGDNLRDITVHYLDPAGVPNQYRFVMYVNSVQVNAIFAVDDEFIDGRYVNLQLIQNDIDIHTRRYSDHRNAVYRQTYLYLLVYTDATASRRPWRRRNTLKPAD